jgi:hypothetical protein
LCLANLPEDHDGQAAAWLCALAGSLIVIIGTWAGSGLAASAASGKTSAVSASAGVAPKPTNLLDCNGYSTEYKEVKKDLDGLCTDPRGTWSGRFEDNGVYIGHDEPSVKFISSAPGTGNTMTYVNTLGKDPHGKPTTSPHGKTVSDYAELSLAPWFGLPICFNFANLNPACETDAAGSEADCNVTTGAGCTAPHTGARFCPFWTLGHGGRLGHCVWHFGNVIAGHTTATFGRDAQYGPPDVARYGGTLASPVLRNPQTQRSC